MINLKRGISTPIAITIIIVLALLLVGGVLGYQYYYLPKKEAKISELKLPEYAVDWQIYKSKKYGFEIRYPEGHLIHKTLGENMKVDGFYIVPENITILGFELAISFAENTIDERIREFQESEVKYNYLKIIEISDYFTIKRDEGKKIKTETRLELESDEIITQTMYLFEDFTLRRNFYLDEELADKIVSTFSILD